MPDTWTPKQERKYEHIKESWRGSGESMARAKEQLYNEARQRNIPGRSRMSKDELRRAVDAHK
jgi:hypothetical protein